jgi:hypothetical protein
MTMHFPLSSLLSRLFVLLCVFSPIPALKAAPDKQPFTLQLKPAAGMTRAELKYWEPPENCTGALVLCPGWNGNGTHLIRDAKWQKFAKKNKLLLVGLNFVSPEDEKQDGYHNVKNGSAKVLFDGLEKIVQRELPIAVFGFSRGGEFAQNLAATFPERVRVWASTGSATCETFPEKTQTKPPGLIICGQNDTNLHHAQETFFIGRRAKWRVCWLEVPNSGHQIDPRAETFTRTFFDAVLSLPPDCAGIWTQVKGNCMDSLIINTWLPDKKTLRAWNEF